MRMPDTVGGCSHDRPMTGRGQFSVTRHTADGRSVPRGDKEALDMDSAAVEGTEKVPDSL
jgi:hypothetical protein